VNNSVFSKIMEDVKKHTDVKLVIDPIEYMKLIAKPNFDRSVKFDEKLAAVHMKETKILYNKLIFLRMCIFELSKTLRYEFHQDYIKSKYGDWARLLMTNIDSVVYEIKTADFYAHTKDDAESRCNTSHYDKDHPATALGFKVSCNKKVV
jgi:hypothetical protein